MWPQAVTSPDCSGCEQESSPSFGKKVMESAFLHSVQDRGDRCAKYLLSCGQNLVSLFLGGTVKPRLLSSQEPNEGCLSGPATIAASSVTAKKCLSSRED